MWAARVPPSDSATCTGTGFEPVSPDRVGCFGPLSYPHVATSGARCAVTHGTPLASRHPYASSPPYGAQVDVEAPDPQGPGKLCVSDGKSILVALRRSCLAPVASDRMPRTPAGNLRRPRALRVLARRAELVWCLHAPSLRSVGTVCPLTVVMGEGTDHVTFRADVASTGLQPGGECGERQERRRPEGAGRRAIRRRRHVLPLHKCYGGGVTRSVDRSDGSWSDWWSECQTNPLFLSLLTRVKKELK